MIIAAGQVEPSLNTGLMQNSEAALDDQVGAGFEKLETMPIQQLAGVTSDNSHKKAESVAIAKGLAEGRQSKKKVQQNIQVQDEEEEERDDFEGFGSITAMA